MLRALACQRTPACRSPEGTADRKGAIEVAVFRSRNGGVFATQSLCPHREGYLADGIVGGTLLICPFHGYRFELVTGRPPGMECQALQTYPVRISDDGCIFIELDTSTLLKE